MLFNFWDDLGKFSAFPTPSNTEHLGARGAAK